MKEYILPSMTGKEKAAFGRVMKNYLLDLDGPKVLDSKHTGREIHLRKLFYGFTEIAGSLDTLDDIELFVGRFPFSGTRVTKERYLQFHVECHLAELYLLRERLDIYLTLLEKQYKKDSRLTKIRKVCDVLRDVIAKSLDGVLRTRHTHIHQTRFRDEDINRLQSIGLLARSGNDKLTNAMRMYFQMEHSRIRKKWKIQIATNNKAVRALLDTFFETIYPLVFDETTHALAYPSRLHF